MHDKSYIWKRRKLKTYFIYSLFIKSNNNTLLICSHNNFFLLGIFCYVYPDVSICFREVKRLFYIAFIVEFSSLLFKQKARYVVSTYTLSAFLSLILIVYKSAYGMGINGLSFKTYVFLLAIGSSITMVSILGKEKLISRIIGNILAIAAISVAGVFLGYYIINGTWFGTDSLLAVMQTNRSEALEYIAGNGSLRLVFAMMLLFILAFRWKCGNQKIDFIENKKCTYAAIILIIASLLVCHKTRENIVTHILVNFYNNLSSYKEFEKQVVQRKNNIAKLDIKKGENAGIFVLVIGESQNRDNMHAYGYSRENTPWLSSIKDNDNVLFFNKEYSCHTHTVQVLTYALTSKNQYNNNSLSRSTSLLEMAEAAGYETVWISNQVKYGAFDTPISVIANEANQQFWFNDNRGEISATSFYDEKLLEAFKNLKIKDKMLIVVHLMGNHDAYDNRYPQEFNKYGNDNNLNRYDNSILYNDYVVENLYKAAIKLPSFSGLVYFADHAEAVQQGLQHDASQYVPTMTQIPMYMYFSDHYIDNHQCVFSNLKNAENKMFTNDLLYNYMLTILEIDNKASYEPNNDLAGDEYDGSPARFRTLHGKKIIEE